MQRRRFLLAIRDSVLLAQLAEMTAATRASEPTEMKEATGQVLKLFLAGDVMLGRGIDQILPHPNTPALHESYVKDAREYVRLAERKNGRISAQVDHRYIWGDALAILATEDPDIRIVNLETSVTANDEFWRSKGIHYRMHPKNLPCLNAAGIDCCVLANNHVLDWGYVGLQETLGSLADIGISTVGAGTNIDHAARPARLSTSDKSDVLVFGFADRSSGVPNSWRATRDRAGVHLLDDLSTRTARKVAEHILALKQPNDVVIASIHWGDNWGYDVSRQQRRFAHYLIDNADVTTIHGHSSHHARPIEIYHGRPIIYGSGDFLNDYEGIGGHEHYRPWLVCMYLLIVNTNTHRLESLEIVPMRIRRFRLEMASVNDQHWLCDKLNDMSKEFAVKLELMNGRLVINPSPVATHKQI